MDNPLLDEFLTTAGRKPTSVAISSSEIELSFSELSRAVLDEVAILQAHKRSFSPDAPLPILVGTNSASYQTLLAALLGGVSCAVLNKQNPEGKILSHQNLLSAGGKIFDSDSKKILTIKVEEPFKGNRRNQEEKLREFEGIVFFSSGSTGAPKGILIDFDCIWWRHRLKRSATLHNPGAVISAFSSPHQVAGLNRLLRLIAGSRLHIVDLFRSSLRSSIQELKQVRVTELNLPSQVARLVAENASRWALDLPSVTSLKIGSEAATFDVVHRVAESLPKDAILSHGLGFTEGPAAFKFIERLDCLDGSGTLPIGRIHNPEFVRLSPTSSFGPETSEVVVSGPIARGYLESEPSESDRFRMGPENLREWWSGDVVRKIDSNNYGHVGRKDRMMKLNGNFLMPSEIENVARLIPGVRQAALVGQKNSSGLKIVLWLESVALGSSDVDEVYDFLQRRLPRWMIPSQINVVRELPSLPGGKIDLQLLEEWI